MSTTQRSESMNAFFDGFVHSKTTLKEFVEQYENALREKAEIELAVDYRSYQTLIPLISQFEFEKQFRLVYTSDKFKEVQSEIARKMECTVTSAIECGVMTEFDVEQYVSTGGSDRHVGFRVCANGRWDDVKCNCRLFEFRGILCRHIFTAMIYKRMYCVSDKYILERWSKNVKRKHTKIRICYDNWADTPEGRRFDMMSNLFHEIVDLAIESDEGCTDVMASLRSVKAKLEKREDVCGSNQPKSSKYNDVSASQSCGIVLTKESTNIGNPPEVHSKGRPRVKRLKSMCEKIANKKKKTHNDVGGKKTIWQTKQPHREIEGSMPLGTQQQYFGTQESLNLLIETQEVQGSMPSGYDVEMSNFYKSLNS